MSEERPPSGDFDWTGERILEMIVRHGEPREILEVLCRHVGVTPQQRQVAFFLLETDLWNLAASGELCLSSKEGLARLDPEQLSLTLLDGGQYEHGWAQHLYSGIGEVLGLFVCLTGHSFEPPTEFAHRIDAVCRLAALAIEQRNLRDELAWQADHDPVTGLYSQAFFDRMLSYHLHQPEAQAALLSINMDRFRLVNDVLGHALGNRVLRSVGTRFRSCLTADDLLARSGGDEFAVLLKNGAPERVAEIATSLLKSLADPLSVDEHQIFISATIGVSCAGPERFSATFEGNPAEILQREANVALYHAKQAGKARWAHYQSSMAATPPERLEMEKCLRSALLRGEMLLYYQPQIDFASGLVMGAEALLRWNPSGLGIISPGTFIPILEETGLIVDFGRWVIREACRQGRIWIEATGMPLRLGVNVSALQIRNPEFVNEVQEALAESSYPAELLEIELTESIFVGDYRAARNVLEQLRQMGVTLALDDFGTGQSSLSYLQQLPFQRLKIDQSFVRSINPGEPCVPMIENIVQMARSMGMSTVAEGIDNAHQAAVLKAAGCDQGQGYYFSFPMPPDEFLKSWAARKFRDLTLPELEPDPENVELARRLR